MRKPAEILELALSHDKDHPLFDAYMCWHLMHIYGAHVITFDEYNETKKAVMAAIEPNIALATHLRSTGAMPREFSMYSHEYLPIRNAFYTQLMIQLQQE